MRPRVILYNPWSTPSLKKPLPMSLLAVAALLEDEVDYEIVDANLEVDPIGRILALAQEHEPTAIGITVMPGPQLERAVPESRRLKAALPGVPIVWGGYFPSLHADTALRDPAVDFCVIGQGERAFLELVRTLHGGGDLAAIAGLSWCDGDSVRHNPQRPLVPLEELPEWPYHRVPMERYIHRHYLGDRVGTHHSSYGCPFGCTFCALVPIVNRKWVAQRGHRVAEVVRLLKQRYAIDAMQFHDMDFFISEDRTLEFAAGVRDLDISWWALGRVDELMRYGESTWTAMKQSGLKMLFCGAETASDEVLRRMNKGGTMTPSLTVELVRRMRAHGVVPELSFVLGSPPDPEADIAATLEFIRRLKQANPETEVILYLYTPVPVDGLLFEEAKSLGFRYPDTLDGWVSGDWSEFSLRRNPHTPWLTPRMRRRVRDFERVLNAYYPTVTDSRLTGAKRAVLRALGTWRYRTRIYHLPVELHAFHRLFGYQRPETTGF